MPLVQIPGVQQLVIQCVNQYLPNHQAALAVGGQQSTMHVSPRWYAVTNVEPPTANFAAQFNPHAGIPVRCYLCRICGYMEMYSGAIASPQVWGPGNG
jgi:hypothetical protein